MHKSESPAQYWTEGMQTDIFVSFLITDRNHLWSWSLKFAVGFSLSLMLFISWGSYLLFLVHWEFLSRNGSRILLNACYVPIMVIIPWRRKWQPTPVFLPEEFCGQRSLVGCSPWGCKESDTTEHAHNTTQGHHIVFLLVCQCEKLDWVLNQSWIPGLNPTWWECIILF